MRKKKKFERIKFSFSIDRSRNKQFRFVNFESIRLEMANISLDTRRDLKTKR